MSSPLQQGLWPSLHSGQPAPTGTFRDSASFCFQPSTISAEHLQIPSAGNKALPGPGAHPRLPQVLCSLTPVRSLTAWERCLTVAAMVPESLYGPWLSFHFVGSLGHICHHDLAPFSNQLWPSPQRHSLWLCLSAPCAHPSPQWTRARERKHQLLEPEVQGHPRHPAFPNSQSQTISLCTTSQVHPASPSLPPLLSLRTRLSP